MTTLSLFVISRGLIVRLVMMVVAGNIPLTVTFTNTSQPIDGASTFNWNFGDGVTSTVVQPTHVYTRAGTFGVTLTARSGVMQDVLAHANFITTTDDTPVLGDFIVGTGIGYGLDHPAVAYNTTRDEYLVVWADLNHYYNTPLYGQRVSRTGHLLGASFAITSGVGLIAEQPRVAYDPVNDQYLVIWRGDGIDGRLISGAGIPGTSFPFSDPATTNWGIPQVAYNAAAQAFLITWWSEVDGLTTLWGQRVSNGDLSGAAFSLADDIGGGPTALTVNPASGAWLATWSQSDNIVARTVSGSGVPAGSTWTIATLSSMLYDLASSATAAGDYLIAWRMGQDTEGNIVGQRLAADGSLLGSAIAIASGVNNTLTAERLVLAYRAASDDFFMVWQHRTDDGYDLRGAYVAAQGAVVTSPVEVITAEADQVSPAMVYAASDNTYLLTWRDERTSGIYARRWRLPLAEFSATPLSGARPLTVTFTNQTSGAEDVTSYLWDFGDGVTSTLTNPVHVYTERGGFDVSLTASTGTYTHTRRKTDYVNVGLPHRTVIDYTYDGLYRLTQADSTGALTTTFEYAYDPVGNRTAQTATITSTVVTAYQYDAANRLIDRTESTGQAYTYAWSDRGQMLAEYFQGNPIRTFTYNAAGQLSEATVLTLTTRFRYNGDGQRLSLEVVGSGTTTYALDYLKAHRILMETTAQTTTLYLYGHSCLGEWNATDGWKYYLQSTLGQVRQAVDDVGNVIYSWAYNPDGTVLQGVQGPITHLECEAVYDWSTGLIYRLGRYFDPTTGVWLMGTGIVLAQAGSKGKRRSKRRLLLLLLLLLCIVGVLAACGGSSEPDCNFVKSPSFGDKVLYVDPPTNLGEPTEKWNSYKADEITNLDNALHDTVVNHFGGPLGFGSGEGVLAQFGISQENPLKLVRQEVNQRAKPGQEHHWPASTRWPYMVTYNTFFDNRPEDMTALLDHEIAHYWDHDDTLRKDMLEKYINWGQTARDLAPWRDAGISEVGLQREDFATAVEVYFNHDRDENRPWTDDMGEGLKMAKQFYPGGGVDSLKMEQDQLGKDLTVRQPSPNGTIKVKDRYDFLQDVFRGIWR